VDAASEEPSAEEAALAYHQDGEQPHDDEILEDDPEEPDEAIDIFACLDRGPNSPPDCPQFTVTSPLMGLSDAEIERRVKADLASLGPITLGPPNRGRLVNGVRMPDGERWRLTDPGNAYGTQETIDSIVRAIDKVHEEFPGAPQVIIGHLSAKNGGHLRPHKSHQSGRDVDLSYFYLGEKTGWFTFANDKNLDKERSWAFVKAFALDPNVEMILVDTSIQRLLRDYALSKGEDQELVDRIFQVSQKSKRPIIRHVRGHATHIHVRFYSPNALATGRLAEAYLPKPPPPPKREGKPGKHNTGRTADQAKKSPGKEADDEAYVLHRARSGDTLDSLARRYGVTVQAIKEANGLRSNAIKEKRTYRIPRTASSGPSKTRQRR
jgi:penicillin-insensitive murein endopeptidase